MNIVMTGINKTKLKDYYFRCSPFYTFMIASEMIILLYFYEFEGPKVFLTLFITSGLNARDLLSI